MASLVRQTFFSLALALTLTACGSSTAPADAGDAGDGSNPDDASVQCGAPGTAACPSDSPICSEYADHNTGALAGSRCEPVPAECAADASCDCLTQAYTFYPDGGRRCPGPVYCNSTDAGLTVRCVPP